MNRIARFLYVGAAMMGFAAPPALAQKQYDPGASDTEIRIGNISPYTGPDFAYGSTGKAEAAYFQMINNRGGVNGRKITFISVDSQSGDPMTLAHTLIDTDKVLLVFGSQAANANLTMRPYLNQMKIPQLFIGGSGYSGWADPQHYPYTMGFYPSWRSEGAAYAKYVLQTKPDAKISVLFRDDELGRDYLQGIHEGLGDKATSMIVKEVSYAKTDPELTGQVATLKASGATVFMNMTFGRYATQAIREAYDQNWHPLQFIPTGSLSISLFLDPAGLQKAEGIISSAHSKSWRRENADDPDVAEFLAWMRNYNTDGNIRDALNAWSYEVSQVLVEVLRKCGDNLTRANVIKQVTSLDMDVKMLRPGIRVTTSPTDYRPIKQMFLVRFNGRNWLPEGEVIGN
jgi:branched-chain amino acid transport system substrate-binding protein